MIAEAITEVKEVLEGAGMSVKDYVPERVSPPLAIISPGEPFVEEGQTFTTFSIRLEVVLVAGKASNAVSTEQLYGLIEDAVFNLGDWTIERVERPYALEANGVQYLATTITLNSFKEIGGQ